MNSLLRHIRTLVAVEQAAKLPDQELVERFVANRDEAAFTTLMERHGAMVLGVCRRVLHRLHDAEDACQATFLVLARRAASIRKHRAVASWLHGVAHRVSRKLRADIVRRTARHGREIDVAVPDTTANVTWREVQAVLDVELGRLPEKYRSPLILCYFEGKTQDEAARELGLSNGALRGLLERGRERLRSRLVRRGVTLSGALFGAVLAHGTAGASVNAALTIPTVKAAMLVAAGQATSSGLVSARAAAVAEGVIKEMWLSKLKILVSVVFLTLASAGLGLGAYYSSPREQPEAEKKQVSDEKPVFQKGEQPKADKEAVQGAWKLTSFKDSTTTMPADGVKLFKVSITDKKLTMATADWQAIEGDYQLDSGKNPKWIDLTDVVLTSRPPAKEKTTRKAQKGIYEIDGDTLRIALRQAEGGERPKDFAGGQGLAVLILKRDKEAKKGQEKQDKQAAEEKPGFEKGEDRKVDKQEGKELGAPGKQAAASPPADDKNPNRQPEPANIAEGHLIDRSPPKKEPPYQSKEPGYCLLVFGPKAKDRVWMVLDGKTLYVDRDGDGDLADQGKKLRPREDIVAVDGTKEFVVGPLPGTASKPLFSNLLFSFKPSAGEKGVLFQIGTDDSKFFPKDRPGGNVLSVTLGSGVLSKQPQDAPVIWLDGPRHMILETAADTILVPGKELEMYLSVGTFLSKESGCKLLYWEVPSGLHPTVEIEFPRKGGGAPIKSTFALKERC